MKPHGVQGHVVVAVDPSVADVLSRGRTVWIGESPKQRFSALIQNVSPHKFGLRVQLRGVADRNRAEEIAGEAVCIDRDAMPDAGDEAYYDYEIIGLRARDTKGTEIGIVREIIDAGSHDVYVIETGDGELLVPAVAHAVVSVDPQQGHIVVDPDTAVHS